MAIMWPSRFPSAPLRASFSESTGSRLKRTTSVSSGPAKVRRKAGKNLDTMNLTFFFPDYTKLKDFTDWVESVSNGLAGGLYAFDFAHPISKRMLRCRIVPDSATGLYSVSPLGDSQAWKITLTFEILS